MSILSKFVEWVLFVASVALGVVIGMGLAFAAARYYILTGLGFVLLTAVCLAAPPASLYAEINAYRAENDLAPLAPDADLEHAAALQCEWSIYAERNEIDSDQHSTRTDWLLAEHPELLWERLYAIYGGMLPDWLNFFDRARLCGWDGGAAGENGAISSSGKVKVSVAMTGWKRSPGHNANLLGDWTKVGYASKGSYLFCVFGK